MDPFGSEGEQQPQDLGDFQVPLGDQQYTNDFYEVEESESGAAPVAPRFHQEAQVIVPAPTSSVSVASSIPMIEEENALTKFNREYEAKIAEKTIEQEKIGTESKAKAKTELEKFIMEKKKIKEAKQKANRTQEQATMEKLAADLESENPWERVVSLVELENAARKAKLAALNGKKDKNTKQQEDPILPKAKKEEQEDLSRMRQLFVQLKGEPLEKTRAKSIASH